MRSSAYLCSTAYLCSAAYVGVAGAGACLRLDQPPASISCVAPTTCVAPSRLLFVCVCVYVYVYVCVRRQQARECIVTRAPACAFSVIC
jgi:hypothetical protein